MTYRTGIFVKKALPILLLGVITIAGGNLVARKSPLFRRLLAQYVGIKADLTINLTDSYSISSYSWKNFAQGGEEKENMLKPVISQINSIHPGYIRIDHIYDFYQPVTRDLQGNLQYNWQKLDNEIANIISTGAKPFISLSYMPSAIASGNEVSQPVNWSDWQEVTKKTIEHVSGRKGLAISDVYYEVWNEPDLFGEYKVSGDKNYLALYMYAARGAQTAANVNNFKFGGPATTSLNKEWFDSLLQSVTRNNLRLDFFSWHLYSPKLTDFEKDINNARSWIMQYPAFQSVEFIISENGPYSSVEPVYDDYSSAIHAIAMAAMSFQQNIKVFTFEIKDGPGEKMYWGRWGLLTHEKFGMPVQKPRFKAFAFLDQLQGNRYVVLGEGSWVKAIAVGTNSNIKLLVVNYDPSGNHTETVPIHFINLPFRDFKYTRYNFIGQPTVRSVSLGENNWTVFEDLPANNASILELTPI